MDCTIVFYLAIYCILLLPKTIELVTIHMDRLDELEKARITATFYIEYINQSITWNQYREYLAIIERVFLQDFVQLRDIHQAVLEEAKVKKAMDEGADGGVVTKMTSALNCDRLIAVGLVQAKRTSMYNVGVQTNYNLTELGLKFAEALKRTKEFR